MEGEDHAGLALLPATDFQEGVIEADIALKITTPPGVRYPGFIGIAFRVRPDASHYELFYLRSGNSDAADQGMRNHAVQYLSEPNFGWYRLRREWPSIYESHLVCRRLAEGSRQGAPGPVHAFLAGWIDGDSGKGRMRVEGRSDGSWVAQRR
jgi:hypothetical protein